MAKRPFTKQYRTALFFLGGLLFSAVAMAVAFMEPDALFWLPLVGVLADGALLRHNETRGFSRSKEMHRADDPPRHFNLFQVLMLYVLILAQLVFFFYLLSH